MLTEIYQGHQQWNWSTRLHHKTRCRAIAGSTARCGCKFRYISKFSAALGGFYCDNNAFELNNSINYGKIRVFNIIYLLPLNSIVI